MPLDGAAARERGLWGLDGHLARGWRDGRCLDERLRCCVHAARVIAKAVGGVGRTRDWPMRAEGGADGRKTLAETRVAELDKAGIHAGPSREGGSKAHSTKWPALQRGQSVTSTPVRRRIRATVPSSTGGGSGTDALSAARMALSMAVLWRPASQP